MNLTKAQLPAIQIEILEDIARLLARAIKALIDEVGIHKIDMVDQYGKAREFQARLVALVDN